jgi:hypothetical protein
VTAPVGGVRHLDVREGCARVAAQASHARIDTAAVGALAERMRTDPPPEDASAWPWPHLGIADAPAETVARWTLLLDAVNFCFWDDDDRARWRVGGEDGYAALARALRRAVDHDETVISPERWVSWSVAELAWVLRGDPGGVAAPPLLADRHAGTVEIGRWLLAEHNGSALAALEAAAGAAAFAATLATSLPRFRDIAEYRGLRVALLKRAQIAAFDCGLALGDSAPRGLRDTSGLTAFADYKLPQVLRHHSVLEYSPQLAATVDARQPLRSGGEEEVEIRALTVLAVDALTAELRAGGVDCDAASVDSTLWWRAQGTPMRPYHRVRSIWY